MSGDSQDPKKPDEAKTHGRRRKGVNDPSAFTSDSSLSTDAHAFGSEVGKVLNPMRMAADAALTATGVKPILDTVESTSDVVRADDETTEKARSGVDAAGSFKPAAGTDPKAPDASAPASTPPGGAPGGTGATAPGKGAKALGGTAKGADAVGKHLGVKGAGDLLRKSPSSGSPLGASKDMAKGAKTGANIGTKIAGPVGTVVGGLGGAALQGAKTKNGRRMLFGAALLSLLSPFILMALLLAMFMMILSPAGYDGTHVGTDMAAYEAATTDGLDPAAVVIFEEAALDAGLHWELLAAIVYVEGSAANPEEAPPTDADLVATAREDDTPTGPYALLPNEADQTAAKYHVHEPDLTRMEDLRASSAFVAPLLASVLATWHGDLPTFSLNAGVDLVESEDPQVGSRLDYATSDDGALNGSAQNVKDALIDALGRMPIENAEEHAEEIYTVAMTWYFGRTQACSTTPAVGVVSGTWTDPVVGPVTSPYGMRFHPVYLVWRIHDGTDLGASNGTPVHAASSGIANVTPTSYGGPHQVTIDHGNNLQTIYEHMDSATITNGQQVNSGDVIGTVGSQGASTGNHLHFMIVESGASTDPVPWMAAHGVNLGVDPVSQTSDNPGPVIPAGTDSQTEPTGDLTPPDSWSGVSAQGEPISLDAHQIAYAKAVIDKAAEMGVSDDGAIIALMTVAQETKFQMYANERFPSSLALPHDAVTTSFAGDSVGLFQQTPPNGWGSASDLMDPGYSASAFLGGPQGPNHGSPMGLLDHPAWPTLSKNDAAQLVQASGFVDAYGQWETPMTQLFDLLKGTTGSVGTCAASGMTGTGGDFTVATLNLLGAGHTNGERPGFDTWDVRLPRAMAALDAAGVSVAGLEEVHSPQMNALSSDSAYTDEWDIYPKSSNLQNAVIWRKSDWTAVSKVLVQIPYFTGDTGMPLVLLQNNATDQRVYVFAVHNPADARGPAAAKRAEALRREAAKVSALAATGNPVLLVGDFNDARDGAGRAHCALTPLMDNAFGGEASPCQVPAADSPVDHIFGSGGLSFTSATVDESIKTDKISDHPLVYASISAGGGNAAIDFALAQVGEAYVFGATGPDKWDCSGLMLQAWKKAGVTLPRTSAAQAGFGTSVSRSDIKPGDLIFYYTPVSHVAMYIGDRNGVPSIVHAANPRVGVVVAPLSEMEGDIVGIRRVLSTS